jgi:hypothetical protein
MGWSVGWAGKQVIIVLLRGFAHCYLSGFCLVSAFSNANHLWSMDDIEFYETIALNLGLTVLMGYMLFIIWQLARESKAGKFGTFVLFLALATGMVGFIAKQIIQLFMEM